MGPSASRASQRRSGHGDALGPGPCGDRPHMASHRKGYLITGLSGICHYVNKHAPRGWFFFWVGLGHATAGFRRQVTVAQILVPSRFQGREPCAPHLVTPTRSVMGGHQHARVSITLPGLSTGPAAPSGWSVRIGGGARGGPVPLGGSGRPDVPPGVPQGDPPRSPRPRAVLRRQRARRPRIHPHPRLRRRSVTSSKPSSAGGWSLPVGGA